MGIFTLPLLFSLIFYATFSIYVFFGIFVFISDMKSLLNRVFLILCLPLCIWAFSFAISISAPDYDTALLWRRIAALGWGTMYSFLLHFILILTEKRTVLRRKWIYLPLYLPAAVNVYAFALNEALAKAQYKLVNNTFGWHNTSANSIWDWIFNVYYAGFTLIGLVLIWRWGASSGDRGKQRQARILVIAFGAALLVGTFTDIVSNAYLSVALPQLAPVVILIPISAVLYSIKRYHLMVSDNKKKVAQEGRILNEVVHGHIYRYISLIFIFGSLMNFAVRYFAYHDSIWIELVYNSVGILIGIAIILVEQSKIKDDLQDAILLLLMAVSTPYIVWRFADRSSITVWAIPFIFILLSVVFSKRRAILVLSISILITQIGVFLIAPPVAVQVNLTDYLVRIGIFGICVWLAFFVNQTYTNRLKENEDQVRFQKMIAQISADFITITATNQEEKIQEMLRLSGDYFQMDRSYLILFSEDGMTVSHAYEWCGKGIEPAAAMISELQTANYPWWMDQILNSGELYVQDLSMLPPEAGREKELLQKMQIRSLTSMAVSSMGKVIGFMGFNLVRNTKSWRGDLQNSLRILANLLMDALAKVQAEQEIHYMAYYDALTGLSNRALFSNRLAQSIHLARRAEKLIGVFFIDLDSFKAVNDTMGHEGGDELLKHLAERLSGGVRKYDTVARFGGDEFLILLNQIERMEDITRIADHLMKLLSQPVTIREQEFFVTASAGIAIYPTDGDTADVLIKNADLAMYISKSKGKNQYTLCSSDMKEDVLNKMQLTNGLYRAQERNELVLYYQPQINVASQKIIGLEALLRWNHPNLGMISPVIFIPLAEQTGLINPIGQWVLYTACRQNKAWQDMGLPPVRMAVNLSVEQLRKPNLVGLVSDILKETGLEAKYLELEITESAAVMEAGYILQVLNNLKKLGVTIAIDDFGTEYSSLSRLKSLPVDRIKIDMQFVHGISEGNKDESIAKIIILLAKNLNLNVIAEGVETVEQNEFFNQQLCDEIQGYYYFRPMPAAEIEEILLNQPI